MLSIETLLDACEINRSRSSGPGGQHRNKVETRVVIEHLPTGITGQAGERRSMSENRSVAITRLRLNLATEHRVGVPIGDQRTELWLSRCKDNKIIVSERHADFPAVLAEAMDMLAATGWDPATAALRLCCSASQLIKLAGKHPPAMVKINEERRVLGLHPLR